MSVKNDANGGEIILAKGLFVKGYFSEVVLARVIFYSYID